MAEYLTLESIPGIRLPDGRLISTPTLQTLLQEHFNICGPPQPPSVAGRIDDPHLITIEPLKGRLAYLPQDKSLMDFFRLYRHGKYLQIETLQRLYFEDEREPALYLTARWVRDKYIENIRTYGPDALAHVCLDSPATLEYVTVSRFLAETSESPIANWADKWEPNPDGSEEPDEREIKQELGTRWFRHRRLMEQWLELPE